MRVLVQSRRDVGAIPGGEMTAFRLKRPFLESKGVTFVHSVDSKIDLSPYDLVYLHTITRVHETHAQMRNARASHVPRVIRPLYNSKADLDRYLRLGQRGMIRRTYTLLGGYERYQQARSLYYAARNRHITEGLRQAWMGYQQQQREVIRESFVTPDSPLEMEDIQEELGVMAPAQLVVPNSIEVSDEGEHATPELFFKRHGLRDFVLCPGRIEPLKNQVSLLRALDGLDVPIVLIGGAHGSHPSFHREVMDLVDSRPNVHYLGFVDREMLYSAFRNAHVVVMPSWTENSGHVALEGGLMGCNVVATDRGYAKWYLREDAWYCDAGDGVSIRSAVENALETRRGARPLRDRLLREFSPERTAMLLYQAFQEAIQIHQERHR